MAAGCAHLPQPHEDASALAAFDVAMSSATAQMDGAALAALWEPDGVAVVPDQPPTRGIAAIRAVIDGIVKAHPKAHMQTFELNCEPAEVAGTIAHQICLEHQIVALDPGQPPFEGYGRMLFVLHRGADGHWRLRREMWQSMPQPKSTP
ncbi:MAG TPA: DUF4440 domain-containing protein [Kofleriaceae bacterium]